MNLSNFLLTAAISADAEAPTLFPYPFSYHIVFVVIATLFFALSFARMKKPYQLIMAIAVPFSLLLWAADDSRIFYYAIGVVEVLLIAAALLSSIIMKPKKAGTSASTDNAKNSSSED